MNSTHLPPLPKEGEIGPRVCDAVRLYLAILDDLTLEQVDVLFKHVQICSACAEEFQLLNDTTRRVGSLEASAPSQSVDAAIMALRFSQNNKQNGKQVRRTPLSSRSIRVISQAVVAIAAILLFLFLTATHFIAFAPSKVSAFELPASLSWSNYVLYHTETITGANGMVYHVESYHDLGSNHMHVETTANGQIDVVVVGDDQAMLGMDMMHHVAQWNADAWAVDDSVFDLAELRHELQTKSAVYLDKESFRGQEVYRIHCKDGLVMLLDMNYMPINVLQGSSSSDMARPMYDSLKLMPSSEVPSSMWDMSVPPGFHMGTLPSKPN
ncbi:MAG TPA: hypothetical protein VEH81_13730 [Ktedonobacteraceae bacterium]|nr:hypothetical protein [Ktedonobacteraceae bacterium]